MQHVFVEKTTVGWAMGAQDKDGVAGVGWGRRGGTVKEALRSWKGTQKSPVERNFTASWRCSGFLNFTLVTVTQL